MLDLRPSPDGVLNEGETAGPDLMSFSPSPETSSSSLKVGACIFIGVGAVTMFMGFLGCIGAIKEVRCLLGLVSTAGQLRGTCVYPGSNCGSACRGEQGGCTPGDWACS